MHQTRKFLAIFLIGAGMQFTLAAQLSASEPSYEALYLEIYKAALKTKYWGLPNPITSSETQRKSIAAYFWGLPLVETTRSAESILGEFDLEYNSLFTPHDRNTSESVVAPNLDVINATGFIDFSSDKLADDKRAIVLTVPDTQIEALGKGTYNIIQVLDAYTNVRGSFGTRPDPDIPAYQPNEGGNFLISGPD